MTTFELLSSILALPILYYMISSIISYRRLAHIPGPKAWAWSRIPLIRTHLDGTCYKRFGSLCATYGPLVRIGPNYLVTSNPDIVRRMSAPRSPYTKSNWYLATRLTPGIDNMISDRDDHRHDIMRKKAAPAYSGKENPSLEKDVDECVLDFVHLFEDNYISSSSDAEPMKMELARKTQFFTIDAISLLAFNAKFGDLKHDTDHFGYIEEVETLFPNMFCTSMLPELMEFLTRTGILSLFNPAKNPKFAFGKVMKLAYAQIDSRLDEEGGFKGEHGDMLNSFIKHGMNRQELEQEVLIQM